MKSHARRGADFDTAVAAARRSIEDLELKIWLAESHPDGPQGAVPERRGQFRRFWRFRGRGSPCGGSLTGAGA